MNLLPLQKGETISAVIATKDFPEDEYLMFATEHGMVKKTSMDLYDRTRRDGLIAINLKEGDQLIYDNTFSVTEGQVFTPEQIYSNQALDTEGMMSTEAE